MKYLFCFFLLCIFLFSGLSISAQDVYKIEFKSQIIDSISGVPLANAEIKFKNINANDSLIVKTDIEGKFKIKISSDQCYDLIITATNYRGFKYDKFYCYEVYNKQEKKKMLLRWKTHKVIYLVK